MSEEGISTSTRLLIEASQSQARAMHDIAAALTQLAQAAEGILYQMQEDARDRKRRR